MQNILDNLTEEIAEYLRSEGERVHQIRNIHESSVALSDEPRAEVVVEYREDGSMRLREWRAEGTVYQLMQQLASTERRGKQ